MKTKWGRKMLEEVEHGLKVAQATFERKKGELTTADAVAAVFLEIVARQEPRVFTCRPKVVAGGETGLQVFPNEGNGNPGRFSPEERKELLEKFLATGKLRGQELDGGIFLTLPE